MAILDIRVNGTVLEVKEKTGGLLQQFESWLSIAASVATILAVIAAFYAARIAWKQYNLQIEESADARQKDLEARAKNLLARNIELCVQYPQFAEPKKI